MVSINISDSSIQAKIEKESSFNNVLDILKKSNARYDNESKIWELPLYKSISIIDQLKRVTRVNTGDNYISKINNMSSNTGIKYFRNALSVNDLKVPPFKGKPPFENYQFDDILSIIGRNRFALFNEQGLGKSYELISGLDYYRKLNAIKKVLFITSNSGVLNIQKELIKFSDFNPARTVIAGVDNRLPFEENIDIVICNYRSFLLISDSYYFLSNPSEKEKRKKSKNDEGENSKLDYRKCPIPFSQWIGDNKAALILDESHLISNPKARQTKVLRLAAPFFDFRYLASGTPADKLEKYYSQLWMLDSSIVNNKSYYEWLQEYAELGTRWSPWAIAGFRQDKTRELQDIVKTHSVCRFANEVLSLPENYFQPYYVEFTPLHRDIYKGLTYQFLKKLKENRGGMESSSIINSFPYLVLSIDNPKLLIDHLDKILPESYNDEIDQLTQDVESFSFATHHSKVEALLDIIEQHPDSKIIVWNSHPTVGDELEKILKKYNPLVIHGGKILPSGMTLDTYKGEIISKFQKDKNHKILIAGIQVLNTAVTIVEANVQIIFDCNFNYTEYSQAMKRIHRIGQNKQVYTYYIAIDRSIDVARKNNLEDKDFLNRNFLSEQFLSKEKLAELFVMEGK